jgi:CDP-diacylglycerol--glycerol-3-phosphate 3-phosphatidyltransferase
MTSSSLDMAFSAGVFGLWAIGLIYYSFRTLTKGRYRTDRVDQMGGTRLFSAWLMEFGYWFVHGIANFFIRTRVGPNTVTVFSLIMALASAVALYFGSFGLGGWLMMGAALLDIMDGWVARALGVAGEAGEYFDSIIDRYCELSNFIAVMGYYFVYARQPIPALIVGLAMVASIMITYARTKGEAQGITGVPSGLMRRHERYVYIGIGTAASPILAVFLENGVPRPVFHLAVAAFALVAIVGNVTAIKLAVQVHRRLRQVQGHAPSPASGPLPAGGNGHGLVVTPPAGGNGLVAAAADGPTAVLAEPPILSTAEVASGRIEEGSRAEG